MMQRIPVFPVGMMSLLLLLPVRAAANTWHIAADGSGDFPTIQAGLEGAAAGDTVLVGAGTYHEILSLDGKNLVLLGESGAASTILSGEGLDAPGASLLSLAWVDTLTVVAGFTFTANGDSATYGGAIYCDIASAEIRDCVFTDNFASAGGAIYCDLESAPRIRDNRFEGNTGLRGGGAVYVFYWSEPEISRNAFVGNRALGLNMTRGCGSAIFLDHLFAEAAVVSILGNTFAENVGEYGTIRVDSGSPLIQGNSFYRNRATAPEVGRASGISIYSASPTIRRNIIAEGENGWGISQTQSTSLLECNDVWGNELGDYYGLSAGTGDFSADPRFCGAPAGDFTLAADSPCLPGASGGCGLVGAFGLGCSEPLGVPSEVPAPSLMMSSRRLGQGGIEFLLGGAPAADGMPAGLEVFDVLGRCAFRAGAPVVSGEARFVWPGTTPTGSRAASGVFYARFSVGSAHATLPFVFLR